MSGIEPYQNFKTEKPLIFSSLYIIDKIRVPGSIPGGTTLKKSKIMKPVEIQHFNGFSFYVYLAENGKFVSLDISHSVVFPESH